MARVKARKLFIATPVARNPVWQYTAALASTVMELGKLGVACGFQFVIGNSVISKARNELCARFLASDATDILFIDDDMDWKPNDVIRLLATDADVIGGVGRMRCQKPNTDSHVWCWKPKTDAQNRLTQGDMAAIEVLGFGAAFMRISRGALEQLIAAHPERKRRAPETWPEDVRANYYSFFEQERVGSGEDEDVTGEDYVFCNRWREIGGRCWIDPKIRLGHVGSFNYAGSVAELLNGGQK